jgi:ABC-type uncharacterized transport system substrate-binding protein
MRHARYWLPAVLLLLFSGAGLAARGQVWVVTSGQEPHEAAVRSLRAELLVNAATAPEIRVVDTAGFKAQAGGLDLKTTQLIVTIGAVAAREVNEANPRQPVLYTLLPRQTYQQLTRADPRDSAIYLDQPIGRQLDLLRAALPRATRAGVVAGPTSASLAGELRAMAKARGLQVVSRDIGKPEELLGALNRVLEESDVLLSLPDPMVFNPHTTHHLLLTTYRHGIPVLGLSRAYVEAGALLAVYSTPGQIGQQIAEVLVRLDYRGAATLPAAQPPRYFSVAVNRRVAAALGLAVPDETQLLRKLRANGDQAR